MGLDITPEKVAIPQEVIVLADQRHEAKLARDFEIADRLRDEILSLGYTIKDTPDGPVISPSLIGVQFLVILDIFWIFNRMF